MSSPIRFDRLCVVLVAPRNPLNIGAAARAMSNFGFARLRVVNPYAMAFREARSAVGGLKVLAGAEEFATVAEAVADCTLVVGTTAVGRRTLQHPLHRLERGGRLIRKRMAADRVALLFGSEKRGLSNADFSHCHWLLHIPTSKENISMNLGQAVAVCLYELARAGTLAPPAEKPALAPAGEVERMTAMLFDALYASGFLIRKPTSDAEERVRRLVRRLRLPARDMASWLGILHQIVWKLKTPAEKSRTPPE
jgi:TrmH family RNA methyltransferase